MGAKLPELPERISFPREEESVLQTWKDTNAFRKANELSEGRPVYSFYDGPPFATGLPHYGHLLAGAIKDTVTRFAYQTGHHVPRRFGWDCHGLPIEFEIEKKLGIKTQEEILELGIDKYNEECRGIVMRFSSEWEAFVNRIGRWIDFENDYKTLDTSFMESCWWVFKSLYEKGLVYRGFKVMPYSTGCTTPLSNFEANLNYKDVNDPAVTVRFPIIAKSDDDPNAGASLLAWTTTPWTLPSNLGLCVNADMEYVFVADEKSGDTYVLAESRLVQLYKNPKKKVGFEVLKKVKGSDLVGIQYEPIFDYYKAEYESRAFRVMSDAYVTDSDGTGIVHQAPAFGEDDYRVCQTHGVIDKGENLPCPVDDNGRFLDPVVDFKGVGVKDADKAIIALLKERGRLVKSENLNHSYPFCWRSDTPLIYRAVPSWFVRVESIKDRLVENNKQTRWVPESVQYNRFGNWLENARDWNVSRNRYWGTPLPIWRNEKTSEVHVVGSIEELSTLSGIPKEQITDLHRHHVDDIEITSPSSGEKLRRVSEVFDCWFESGSMPYASVHYPFGEGSDSVFEKAFPADFIAEGLDQTRGWFYTLMVLSTALFDKPAFKNCVVNGMVLASDGKKMSKRLKNYPDPMHILQTHGADALRLYLINSPVVRGEPLRFREEGVRDVIRDVMLPWFNAFRFFVQNAKALELETGNPLDLADVAKFKSEKNQMDLWVESALGSLTAFVHEEMGANRLYTVVPRLLDFIDELTNWYVRLNRPRLKGTSCSEQAQRAALGTLGSVLLSLARLMAPFTPFFSEYTYKALKTIAPADLVMDSVHFLMLPDVDDSVVDKTFEKAVSFMQEAILKGRVAREHRDLALKQPLREATIVHRSQEVLDSLKVLEEYIKLELNVRTVSYSTEESMYVVLKADADGRVLGKKLGKAFKVVHKAVRSMSPESVLQLEQDGSIELEGHVLQLSDVKISRELRADIEGGDRYQVEAAASGLLVVMDTTQDEELLTEGVARELVNRVQRLRKKAHLDPKDRVEVFVDTDSASLNSIITAKQDLFASLLSGIKPLPGKLRSAKDVVIVNEQVDAIGDDPLSICLTRSSLHVSLDRVLKLVDNNATLAGAVDDYVRARSPEALGILDDSTDGATVAVSLSTDDQKGSCELVLGEHLFRCTADQVAADA